jgi:hypothetical protein
MIKVQRSDGGKVAEGFAYETNDCTVRTLANTTGLSYKESHRLAKLAGRRDHSGMDKIKLTRLFAELVKGGRYEVKELPVPQVSFVGGGLKLTRFGGLVRARRQRVGGTSVAQFVRTLPKKGSFYLACSTHAFAIVDGVLRDGRLMGRGKMFAAWQITQVYPQAAPQVPEGERVEHKSLPAGKPFHVEQMDAADAARRAEMEEMKRKIARLEEMKRMKERIALLERQLGVQKAQGATAGN